MEMTKTVLNLPILTFGFVSNFVICASSFVIRHSSFVIRHSCFGFPL